MNTFLNFSVGRRIEKARVSFIFELKNEIYGGLYKFDEKRISDLAIRITKRMDANQIDSLITKLEDLK
ncbi:hypothetical protein [Psychroflexus sp. MES1-P1E]|jgi:hypothetical protein|uniref:hypothetical protein n=1 Tax=Psychroflexus sp. MES1-P1E TaxID=2058320 RepID=UPI000C7C33D2|nr:hypothetical protein [Psychroflexus sp. MES1-P1E]PKG44288.1 hypothetical protein CXF67_00530 [Psychroflexus sp. MES1-P1E]